MEYVSKKIATIANFCKISAPKDWVLTQSTYQQLVESIFNRGYPMRKPLDVKEEVEWLEFWYNTLLPELQDNEFVLEGFVGMLLNWFERNGIEITSEHVHGMGFRYTIWEPTLEDVWIYLHETMIHNTRVEALHEAILEVFKILKQ